MFGRSKPEQAPDATRRRTQVGQSEGRQAFSYYTSTNRVPERVANDMPRRESPNTEERRKKYRPRSIGRTLSVGIIILIGLICAAKILTLSGTPRVVVMSSGTDATYIQDNGIYAQAAQKLLEKSKLNGFKLTADLTGVSSKLKAEFPELQAVSMTLPIIGNRPIVYIMPAQTDIVLRSGDSNFAVNSSGVVLTELTGSTSSKAVTVIDQTGLTPMPGKRILPASTVAFIQRLNYQLIAGKQNVSSIILPASSAYEVNVQLEGRVFYVKVNLQGEPVEQAGAILASIANGVGPSEYLDVRVPGRVYYK